jgi:hypothetical protein
VVDALQLDPACPRNVLRQIPADLDRKEVTFGVEHEGGYGDIREHTTHVDFTEDSHQ